MAICGCPDYVVFGLRRIVQAELNKLKAIVERSLFFDDAISDVIGLISADVDAAVAAIPSPIVLDFTDLVDLLTCPLLPLALGVEVATFQDLDPTVALEKAADLKRNELARARSAYENSFLANANAKLIRIARDYVRELTRLRFDVESFTQAVVISATVLQTCGLEEYTEGPYAEFANFASDFSMENGVPSNLSNNSQAIVQKLLQGEAKLKALRISVVGIPGV